jgi:hypothetical protein
VENNNQLNNFQQEDTIDIKALVFQALSYWKLFVLSVTIAMLAAYFFNNMLTLIINQVQPFW